MGAGALLVAGIIPALLANLYTDNLHAMTAEGACSAIAVATVADEAAAHMAAERDCLADVMYYEARGEGLAGEKAVAEVVMQRTHDRNYPGTVCGVVYDGVQADRRTGCQFSFACDGSTKRPKEPAAWNHVQALARQIVSGAVKLGNETGHAIAFHSIGVTPEWADTMLRTVQIGNHVFYKRAPYGEVLVKRHWKARRPSRAFFYPTARSSRLPRCPRHRKSSPTSRLRALCVMAPEEI